MGETLRAPLIGNAKKKIYALETAVRHLGIPHVISVLDAGARLFRRAASKNPLWKSCGRFSIRRLCGGRRKSVNIEGTSALVRGRGPLFPTENRTQRTRKSIQKIADRKKLQEMILLKKSRGGVRGIAGMESEKRKSFHLKKKHHP